MPHLERTGRGRVGAAAVAVGLALCVVPASAEAAPPRTVCVPFLADGAGQDLGEGKTEGTLSVDGRPIGTTEASFTLGPGTGAVATFTGPLVFTPAGGPRTSITAQLAGTFDTASGDFAAQSTALTGSGVLRRLTGTLRVEGVESLTDGSFTETLTGQLCVPAGHRQALERVLS